MVVMALRVVGPFVGSAHMIHYSCMESWEKEPLEWSLLVYSVCWDNAQSNGKEASDE